MIFAALLAGGKGTRLGNLDKPKQFLELNDKAIIIHTLEKFLLFDEFEKILILVPKNWINYTKDIIKKEGFDDNKIIVLEGGKLRNDTIMKSIDYIIKNYEVDEDDILLTHDSVRPFVSYRIIKENINLINKYDICNTVIPATDTIVESKDGKIISHIPDRSHMYMGQTPQTFKLLKFKRYYDKLNDSQKEILTDATKIFILNNEDVALIRGEVTNIKITYISDLKIAKMMINNL